KLDSCRSLIRAGDEIECINFSIIPMPTARFDDDDGYLNSSRMAAISVGVFQRW
ncbi:hypothetical protein ACJ73_10353, partial [Blastomyces percursus]